ncbi:MAG TPA: transcriptional initiation protein Tat, partial [Burkholderiaceae bacterium]
MDTNSRRGAIQKLGLAFAAGTAALGGMDAHAAARAAKAAATDDGAKGLSELTARLAKAPRRRDFKTVPMILNNPDQWDHEALAEVLAYKSRHKQVWDNTDIAGPWINTMRNSLNTQVWSFGHPDFLVVSATHGSANYALYDQETWDKYNIGKLAGKGFDKNVLIVEKEAASADPADYENPAGVYSSQNGTIVALQKRGAVFLSCHNAIWEQAARLRENDSNPDKLSQEALAAELTNHLIPGVIVIPGAVGTLPELQAA